MRFVRYLKEEMKAYYLNRRFILVFLLFALFLFLVFKSGFIKYVLMYFYSPTQFKSLFVLVYFYSMTSFIPFFSLMVSYDAVSSQIHNRSIYYIITNLPRNMYLLGKFVAISLFFVIINLLVYVVIAIYLAVNGSTGFHGMGLAVFSFLSLYSTAFVALFILISVITRRPSLSLIFSIMILGVSYIFKVKLGIVSIFSYIPKMVSVPVLITGCVSLLGFIAVCILVVSIYLEVIDL